MIRHLQKAYPNDFGKFEAQDIVGNAAFPEPRPDQNEVLNLCIQCGVGSCLPFAYWNASYCGIDALMESHVPGAVLERTVLQNAIKGALALKVKEFEHVKEIFKRGSPQCKCVPLVRNNPYILDSLALSYSPFNDPDIPGGVFGHLAEVKNDTFTFCNGCRSYWREIDARGRRRIWGDLPSYFGMPSWEELTNETQ